VHVQSDGYIDQEWLADTRVDPRHLADRIGVRQATSSKCGCEDAVHRESTRANLAAAFALDETVLIQGADPLSLIP